jgi:hypothetical protein
MMTWKSGLLNSAMNWMPGTSSFVNCLSPVRNKSTPADAVHPDELSRQSSPFSFDRSLLKGNTAPSASKALELQLAC